MSRKLEEIYNESVKVRNERLELTEIQNDSKMSIMNAITWVTSTVIHSFETILDVFMADLVKVFNNRINGTPAYYANAMLKWQMGDKLEVNEDGTQFHYPVVDPSKRVISYISYDERYNSHYRDTLLILKAAKGQGKEMSRLSDDELLAANKYLQEIKFAGVTCKVVSRKGDVLVPKLTVYYDGAMEVEDLKNKIDEALINYIQKVPFDATIYMQKVIDVIQAIDHVTDVAFVGDEQGIYLAQYNDDDELGELTKMGRKTTMSSGYLKQSTGQGQEAGLPTFRESIVIKLESEA